MKKKSIKRKGVTYSAYTTRAKQILKEAIKNKSDKTMTPMSFMLALGITPLVVQHFV